jgi:hypothetical protein
MALWMRLVTLAVVLALCVGDHSESTASVAEDGQEAATAAQWAAAAEAKPTSAKAKAKAVLDRSVSPAAGGYNKIANFVVSHRSHKVAVKSRYGCENVCEQHDNCKSFSYRPGDKRCLWSEEALHYDSRFAFFMKITKMDDMGRMKPTGEYKRFDSIAYKENGWRKVVVEQPGCKDLCNKMNRCGAFSWREFDKLCLLADDSIKYDTDFDYYERNKLASKGTEVKVTRVLPPKAAIAKETKKLKSTVKQEKKKIKAADKKVKKAVKSDKKAEEDQGAAHDREKKRIKENNKKLIVRQQLDDMRFQTTSLIRHGRMSSRESKNKATTKIKTAFQEGYMKAQAANGRTYERSIKEVAYKTTEDKKEHAGKITTKMKALERRTKEKLSKEKAKKKAKAKARKKETKTKAELKVMLNDLDKTGGAVQKKETTQKRSKVRAKLMKVTSTKRRAREKGFKGKLLKSIQKKKVAVVKMTKKYAKERKTKVHHEADGKDKAEVGLKHAKKEKEQAFKGIEKKAEVLKRMARIKGVKKQLAKAKATAAEINDKHREKDVKVGHCKERRAKGQYVSYAYCKEGTFTSGMSASTKYGADAKYAGFLRVQNGLGNKQQNAYLRFDAKGNRIVEESQQLGDAEQSSFFSRTSLIARQAKAKETAAKAAKGVNLRRRYSDRRRRMNAEAVKKPKQGALASRRRLLQERRRRSLAVAGKSNTKKAVLHVYKFGGPSGKLTVKSVLCSWTRGSLDFASAVKLSIPVNMMMRSLTDALLQVYEGTTADLSADDTAQTGYWGNRRVSLGDSSTRRAVKPFVLGRRRYIDVRRRTAGPAPPASGNFAVDPPKNSDPARRRRVVGATAGVAFAPATTNVWVQVPLSPQIVGAQKEVGKMCFEISGGAAAAPIILGSEKSSNKPFIVLNQQGGAPGPRRRRCRAVVQLKSLEAAKAAKAKPKEVLDLEQELARLMEA